MIFQELARFSPPEGRDEWVNKKKKPPEWEAFGMVMVLVENSSGAT